MSTPMEKRSLGFYAKEYRKYLIPVWLFPAYFIAWGVTTETLKPRHLLIWFFLTVAPVFFGTEVWAVRARKHMPYWNFVFLALVIPFLIFVAIALALAIAQTHYEIQR
ncbi:MAG: hypothetical protein ACFUZC_13570 [Chthoniobacteraceae bacterium]